ncbi:MAG TPA: ThuA domain-containing protein [Pirellulales bacterium]|nr:ThuA domain-containing protein [Pirellulales bacterium]
MPILAALAGCLPPAQAALAAEDWADPRLTMTEGLAIWFDAARLNDARRANHLTPLAAGSPVDTWFDASGNQRHVLQADDSLRPTFESADGYAAVRFDGERQFLAREALASEFRELTVFLVATPFSNLGDFRGLLAINKTGVNDYVSGLTIDQGPGSTVRFQSLNVEGAGFGGAMNLLRGAAEFGLMQRLCVTSRAGPGGTRLFASGKPAGERDRGPSTLFMDHLTVGARYYTNGGPAQVRGFFDGDLVELLVYNRSLDDAQRQAVESYLEGKYGEPRKVAIPHRPGEGKPLVRVADPPAVQFFVPGFSVKEIPVELTNVNNVLYRDDGKLVALAYNGNIYLLSDSDGDGLEDKVELFWDNRGRIRSPIGMALTPPGYRHGRGVFVAAKGKCSLIVAGDGGDKADKEVVVADGWEELPHGVDALGVAFDERDGSVYFGLGTASYTEPYLLDSQGRSQYRLTGQRGTILRVKPDFSDREIFCTGVRFSVGLRFNRAGDLFCTDQEGGTWLANGNPFDELLHLERGRHYGFPPRHPRHLPDVVDEPSVCDYTPQHQSTCGFAFNEPVGGGPLFGPEWWKSDALVTGYSRGKLYRTKLAKTPAGYVAQNQLIASANMLSADACLSPTGDLVLAVHSGEPDWGSGPDGKGKLFKIGYARRELAQPALVWAQGPREVRVAFDRPLSAEHLRELRAASIEFGKYVSAGDRFECHWPGYQVVHAQQRSPRFELPVVSTQVSADRRTVFLHTAPHPHVAGYALTLPGLGRTETVTDDPRERPQVGETDLKYDLCGVSADWQPKSKGEGSQAWLPHLDLAVARQFTAPSADHEQFWRQAERPGTMALRTKLNLFDLLRPAVQPGSTLDYSLPEEEATLVLRSPAPMRVVADGKPIAVEQDGEAANVARIVVKARRDQPLSLQVVLETGDGLELSASYFTREDARPRALPLARLLLPWASVTSDAGPGIEREETPELAGGNWERGRKVFFSAEAACAKCHQVGTAGGAIGPNLSNLPRRDYASVLRDISLPSAAINPDYISHVLALDDGRVLTGTIRTVEGRLLVSDTRGEVTSVEPSEIEALQTSAVSIMPEGLPARLGTDRLKDLLTFLLTEPPTMPDYGGQTPPEPRDRHEIDAVLAGASEPAAQPRPIHVVLVAGQKDHGPGEHDYPAWLKMFSRLLAMAEGVRVTTAMDWPAAADWKTADAVVFYQHGTWTAERARDVDAYLTRGGGLTYIHWAVDGGSDAPGFAKRIGLAWQGGSKFRHGPLDLDFRPGKSHPVARNFEFLHLHDESYWALAGDRGQIRLLASGVEEGEPQPLFWTMEPAAGRVFVSIPGHYSWTFDDPLYRILLLRGIAWSAKEPVDRLNALATPGARIKP